MKDRYSPPKGGVYDQSRSYDRFDNYGGRSTVPGSQSYGAAADKYSSSNENNFTDKYNYGGRGSNQYDYLKRPTTLGNGRDTLENRSSAYEPKSPMYGQSSQYRDLVGKRFETDLDKLTIKTPTIPQR